MRSDWYSSLLLLLSYFQDLKEDPTAGLKKLLDHLKLKTDEGRLRCIDKHSAGSFHRKKHEQEDPYSGELHNILDKSILAANKLLRENTGRALPLEKYKYFTDSQ